MGEVFWAGMMPSLYLSFSEELESTDCSRRVFERVDFQSDKM